MVALADVVPPGSLIGLDACVFIYWLERSPGRWDVVAPLLRGVANGRWRAVTSTVTLMEIAVRPLQVGQPDVATDYEVALLNFPNLTVVDVDPPIARRAAELRARLRLRPADSLQVATALESGATYFVTNDRGLERVTAPRVLVIDELDAAPAT